MDKINKLFIICLVFLVITPFVSSASILIEPFTYPVGRTINLSVSCEDIICDAGDINITIIRDGYLELDDQVTIKKNGYAYYPFLTNTTGDYLVYFTTAEDNYGTGFSVTTRGDSLTEGEAIIYIIILLFAIFILISLIYGGLKIPWQHLKDVNGITIGVNSKKIWKITCWTGAYFVGLWVIAMIKSLSNAYLYIDFAGIFDWIYWVLLSFAIPIFIVAVIILFVTWVDIKKVNKWVEQQTKFGQ